MEAAWPFGIRGGDLLSRKAFDAMIKVTSTLVGQASSAASDIQQILDSKSKKETEKERKKYKRKDKR